MQNPEFVYVEEAMRAKLAIKITDAWDTHSSNVKFEELAKGIGISAKRLNRILSADESISSELLARICEVLKLDLNFVFTKRDS